MAAKLECEICGGKLIGKPGGIFECDSCGVEYSTEWAKAKIQEIRGTVKVEGTVEVTGKVQVEGGTVQVEGAVTKESLLKRAEMCCAEEKWKKVQELLEQVLNIDPECGEAYLIAVMVGQGMKSKEELHAYCTDAVRPLPDGINMARAQKFLPELFAQWREEKEKNHAAMQAQYEAVGGHARKMSVLAGRLIVSNSFGVFGLRADGTVLVASSDPDVSKAVRQWSEITSIYGSYTHIVGLRVDGTVVAAGENDYGQCNVGDWRDVCKIVLNRGLTFGICKDGTVVATGDNEYGQCKVRNWRNIVAIALGDGHTVGLRADGTVVAVGENSSGQCNVENWKSIAAIACDGYHTIGLRIDGTVVARGSDGYDQCSTKSWRNIVAISTCYFGTFGLRNDGTVVATKPKEEVDYYHCNVGTWRNIAAIYHDDIITLGLCTDGTVVFDVKRAGALRELDSWTNIVSVTFGDENVVGLKTDGTVSIIEWEMEEVTRRLQDFLGMYNYVKREKLEGEVSDWRLFGSIDTLEQEHKEGLARAKAERIAKEKAEAERIAKEKQAEAERQAQKRSKLLSEQDRLRSELSQLKGLFSGKRRKEIEAQLGEILAELQELEERA